MFWEAQSLRLTLFSVLPVDGEKTNWWERLVGLPPESKVSLPRINGYEESGPVEHVGLELHVQPDRQARLKLLLPSPKDDLNSEVPPVIGPLPEALDQFGSLAKKWLAFPDVPQVERLAFGAILHRSVRDRKTGYKELSEYLAGYVKIDAENSSDFSYSINRPRPSGLGIKGLQINRLSKWSVVTWSWMRHTISRTSSNVVRDAERFSCHLELDISTDQNFKEELDRGKLEELYDELVAFGLEIAEKGDIP